MQRILHLASLVAALAFSNAAHAGSAFDEFSSATNPSGSWSYGWTPNLAGSFTLFSNKVTLGNNEFWFASQPPLGSIPGYPEIDRNPVSFPNLLLAHPGSTGEYAVLRWIAPTSSTFTVVSNFTRQDATPTTTDVHVLLNGVSLFAGELGASAANTSFSQNLSLAAGDVLDFAVGYGANGNYFSDRTGIGASVSAVPEPATLMLFVAGVCCLVLRSWRNRETSAGDA